MKGKAQYLQRHLSYNYVKMCLDSGCIKEKNAQFVFGRKHGTPGTNVTLPIGLLNLHTHLSGVYQLSEVSHQRR